MDNRFWIYESPKLNFLTLLHSKQNLDNSGFLFAKRL